MPTNALAPQNENALNNASFGLFPHINKYRKFNDRESSANMPIQAALGSAAATGGFLSDLLSNFQSPTGNELTGDVNYAPGTKLPYGTHELSKMLPLQPTTPNERFARGLGEMIPINPAPALRAVGKVGEMALRGAGEMANARMLSGESMVPGLSSVLAPSGMKFAKEPGPIRATAPVSELGFYSAVEKQALNIPRNQGSGESFLNDLLKGQDVKKYEIEAMGLADYLKGKTNVTKKEVQDFIANNKIDVKEKQLGEGATKHEGWQLPGGQNYREILLTLPNQWDKPRAAQTANEAKIQALRQEMRGTSGTDEIRSEISRLNKENTDLQKQISQAPIYQSSHFNEPNILAHMRVNDRVDADGKKMLLIEEVQSDWHQAGRKGGYAGENQKALLKNQTRLGEIDKILASAKYTPEEGSKLLLEQNKLAKEYGELESKRARGGDVPDAPFKETWHELALKRAIKEAVDKGYDRVGITTGKQQIDRFSDQLRQNVSQIEFQTGTKLSPSEAGELQALRNKPHSEMRGNDRARMNYLSNNEGMFVKPNETRINAFNGSRPAFSGTVANGKFLDGPGQGKTVEEVLGTSIAKQIAEKPSGTISGENLSVGGEGMKKYYDEIYPGFLNKLGKKYGSKVGETRITSSKQLRDEDFGVNDQRISEARNDYGERGFKTTDNKFFDNYSDAVEHEKKLLGNELIKETIRYLDITPEMRKAVKEGQPLASNKLLQYLA